MTVTKLSKKDVIKSISAFTLGAVGLVVIVFLMIVINEKSQTGSFIAKNKNDLIITAAAIAVLTVMLYCYFLFENKVIFKRISKMVEIFLLLYMSLMLAFIGGWCT